MRVPETAFAGAVLRLLEKVGDIAQRPITVTLAGGAAVHMYTQSRVSVDVDAEFSARILLPSDLVVAYTNERGEPETLVLDTNYNSTLGLLHENYEDDAVELGEFAQGKIKLRVLSPVDLAVSKLSRFAEHDRADIKALADAGLVTSDSLRERAMQALSYYVGYPAFVRANIDDAVRLVHDVEQARCPDGPGCT